MIDQVSDALLALPAMGRALLSPDGRHVAWTWYRKGPAGDVFIAATEAGDGPRRLTATPDDTYVVSWAPDSASLVVAEDRGGDERLQLFRLALDGATSALTEPSPRFFLRGGMLDPTGRHLVFAANWDPDSGREIEPSWIIRQDLASGERAVLARPERPHHFTPLLNRAGDAILYTRRDRDPAGTQLWRVAIDGTDDREIVAFDAATKVEGSWLPDGRRVLFTAETATHKRLGLHDAETGERRWLIDDPARAIEWATAPLHGGRVVVVETRAARSRATLLDPDTGREEPVAADSETLLPLGARPDGDWVARAYSARSPDDIVRLALADGRAAVTQRLARPFAGSRLRADDLIAPEDLRWRSDDGLEIQGWLYRPRDAARGLVVQVHGGPTAHSEEALSAWIQCCVAAGFAVLDPNYRGSTGFGLAFREAIRADGWGGREMDDIRTGIEAMLERGVAAPGTVAITGTSYGGYASWCAITRWPRRLVAAAAPICGMTDLVVDYDSTRPDLRSYSEEMLGGSPAEVPEIYRARSPINFVERIEGRLLIVQGLNDPNVTPENLHAVERGLTHAGIGYETLLFDDEGHGIRKPKNLRILYNRQIDFFGSAIAQ